MTRFNALRSVLGNQMLQGARNADARTFAIAELNYLATSAFTSAGLLQHRIFRAPVSVFRGVYHCFLGKIHPVLEKIGWPLLRRSALGMTLIRHWRMSSSRV